MRDPPGRTFTTLLTLLLAACQPAGPARVDAPTDSAAGEIGFDWAGPGQAAITVPVYLNGQGPFTFVLDTGATLTCVDESLAERLELPEARGQIGVGATVTGAGRMRLLRIDSLRVGQASASGLTGCAISLASAGQVGVDADGLLGLNFLRSFRLTLDFPRGVLGLLAP